VQELSYVGKDVPRVDAVVKVTGKAMFGSDFTMAGMLHAKVLRSPHRHAKIVSIDKSKAEALPGVRIVVTPEDMPQIPISPLLGDQCILSKDNKVRCLGEPVVAVAADSVEIAEQAVQLIDVVYEELSAVVDIEEAFEKSPPVVVHPDLPSYKQLTGLPIRPDPERPNVCQTYKIHQGDVERGFKQADLIVENRFTTARIQHVPMEPHIALAWVDSDGVLTVRSSTQLSYLVKDWLCRAFSLSPSEVRMLSPFIGGGFGGKGGMRAEAVATLLCLKSGRPVRVSYTREDMFIFGGHRVPYVMDIKDGIKKDGTLVAREMRVLLDLGAYSDFGPLLVRRAVYGAVGTYRIPNFKLDSYGIYTNSPLTGALRGFGCPEVQWPIEQQMDALADKLGIDPVEIREVNILKDGDRDVSGMITRSMGVKECLDRAADWISWGKKEKEADDPWKIARGIAIGNKSVSSGHPSAVTVKVWQDGVVEVRHSAARLGQGISTTVGQIAAEQFNIPVEQVRVTCGDTSFCPFDFGTVASRSMVHVGNALIAACRDAQQQLFSIAAPKLGVEPAEMGIGAGKIFMKRKPEKSVKISELFTPFGLPLGRVEIVGEGYYSAPAVPEDPETGQSERAVFGYSHAASGVEVAVNVETGEVKVLRHVMACDVGKAVNPKIVEGQIEGGIGMGIGTSIYEEVVMNQGAVVNASLTDYHIPTSLDMPRYEDSKAIIVEVADPEGPFGAKGTGEVPLVTTAPAVANAVYRATGVRIKDLPLSKEKVLAGIQALGKNLQV